MEPVFASTEKGSRADYQLLFLRADRRWTQLLCVLVMLVLLSITVGQTEAAGVQAFPTDAIGRLFIDDHHLCTAFIVRSTERRYSDRFSGTTVVYENWLATAGHCLGGKLVFQLGSRMHETRAIGFSAGGPSGFDVMVLSFVTERQMPFLEPAFGEYPQPGDPLMLLGYGSKALMMRVSPLLSYNERGHMEIHGYASRGNSGGPVLIPGTRRVVGIGIETTLDKPEGASFAYCMLAGCAVKPPYIAAHIDRLKGVASFYW